MTQLAKWLLCAALSFAALAAQAQVFDHAHSAWDALLQKHVRIAADGRSSRVDYKGLLADRAKLQDYLHSLSAATPQQYGSWTRPQQFAFLANAYNALTVELVLTRYPNLKSIKDIGSFLQSPWRKKFFALLGEEHHLDWIEHDMLRAPGAFDDPRVHVAVNCASIGCPMLGNRAFTAEQLDAHLEDLFVRFMADRSRNRYNPRTKTVELSMIFDWYRNDFEAGGGSERRGYASLQGVVARYADQLADAPADRRLLRGRSAPLRFLDYDWTLNDVR